MASPLHHVGPGLPRHQYRRGPFTPPAGSAIPLQPRLHACPAICVTTCGIYAYAARDSREYSPRSALAATTPLAGHGALDLACDGPDQHHAVRAGGLVGIGIRGGSIGFRAGAGGVLGVVTHGPLCVPCGRRGSGLDGNPAGSRCIGAFAALGSFICSRRSFAPS
ncbi:hypothetical protein VM1G_11334 [Cytospora mali]|uniref:Uncharacterized protein n=1 Tax=Cytospora mali TaxID=578113 RepID=A0A194VP04_CYTMA|nr:hypothetical protein VM1G_11334 [Valsa mali]